MAWPSGSDYQTAVQNPKTAFKDSELQDCSVRPGAMGMPWVASGSFASVFCLIHPSGQKFAARVFNRQVTVQKDRYKAVSDHLGGIVFPFMVSFEYQEQGIQISGQWYPIIKMGWVDGVQFGKAVEDNANNPDVLRYMAAQLRGVNSGLEGNQMSHCDLQHGNIMVSPQGDMILVDYDDCFVPSLAGEKAIALGMPNYQHPARGANDFNEHIDHFSALVIYMSLGALAADPSLFQKHNNGDNLVLKEADYKDLNAPVWRDLGHSPEPVVKDLVDAVRDAACGRSVGQVPSLEEVIKQTGALPPGKRPAVQTTTPTLAPTPTPTPTPTLPTRPIVVSQPTAQKPIAILPVSQKNFGQVVDGSSSATWNLEVKNDIRANADLIIQSVVASDPQVSVSHNPQPIKPGDTFFITVELDLAFKAVTQPTRFTGTVTIDTNDKQLAATVLCDVVPKPQPNLVVPAMCNFGDVLIGSQAQWELEVRNTGQGDLQGLIVSCTDPAVRITPYSQTIAAGASEKVAVVYEPTQVGDLNTTVSVAGSNTWQQDVKLSARVVDKGIRRLVPSGFLPGDTKDIVVEGAGFVQDRRPYQVDWWEGQGKNRQKRTKTEYDIFNPTLSFSAPVSVADIQFVSTTAIRASVSVPKTCPPGNYDVIVTNPDGTQIVGRGMLEIQSLPAGQVRCPHCNGLTTSNVKWCDKCGLPLRSSVLSRV